MSLKCGIVGLPNVGKSTLFNTLGSAHAPSSNYPFCTIDPNISTICCPDPKLEPIRTIIGSKKATPATTQIVDIAGLVKGASKGEGLGNMFLGHIREVDAIIHVVRCFTDDDIVHVEGPLDPERDIETVNMELILADLQTIERKLHKDEKASRVGDKKARGNLDLWQALFKHMDKNLPARSFPIEPEQKESFQSLFLLTSKPVLYLANASDREADKAYLDDFIKYCQEQKAQHMVMDTKLDAEIHALAPEEREEYLLGLGLKEPGSHEFIRNILSLLDLITFYSANANEVRAWNIARGTKAPQAAGTIHSDFEKGFIRAECYQAKDLLELESEAKVKESGLCRQEGKDYRIQPDDVLLFKFNV